jgi:excisionase family DNA binding protein
MQTLILSGYTPEQFKELFKESFKEIAGQLNSANALSIGKKSSAINIELHDKKEEAYLTRSQAASFLQMSLPTLHQYTKDGLITSFRIGHKIRYKQSDIENAMQERNFGKRRA